MLSPSKIEFSVRHVEFQSLEDSMKSPHKSNIDNYTEYFYKKNDHHDVFIVFEDLSNEGSSLQYIDGSMCKENSIIIVDILNLKYKIGDDQSNHPDKLALKILYGLGRIMGFKDIQGILLFNKRRCSKLFMWAWK
ncbi:LOW QUALITY PROTEIN: hypothetical protein MXB_2871 [Myxobolus squamalis]|nr:LOW QUALITY PROTEIN: hypothetical protein MXB_2871 [Myxobolus squamalis]